MSLLEESEVNCPYCDTRFAIELEPGLAGQQFIEDCPVCCQPIDFEMTANIDGSPRISVRREDE